MMITAPDMIMVVVDDDDDDYQREQSAFHLSSPTSICGSLNTTIRQGVTLIWIMMKNIALMIMMIWIALYGENYYVDDF